MEYLNEFIAFKSEFFNTYRNVCHIMYLRFAGYDIVHIIKIDPVYVYVVRKSRFFRINQVHGIPTKTVLTLGY